MQTFTVLNQSGGCGKTTLAVHLACHLAERGHNLAVIDADPQARAIHWLSRAAPGILTIAAIEPGEVAGALEQLAAADVELVIADAKPGLDPAALELLKRSDRVYMPIVPSAINLDSTEQAILTMRAIGVLTGKSDDFAWGFLSIVDPGGEQTRARQRLIELGDGVGGMKAAAAAIGRRMVFRAAYAHGSVAWRMPAVSSAWKQPARLACLELNALFAEILPDEFNTALTPSLSQRQATECDHVAA